MASRTTKRKKEVMWEVELAGPAFVSPLSTRADLNSFQKFIDINLNEWLCRRWGSDGLLGTFQHVLCSAVCRLSLLQSRIMLWLFLSQSCVGEGCLPDYFFM